MATIAVNEDNTYRPTTFDAVRGQEEVKQYLKLKVDSYRKTGEPLGHLLFLGPSGLGKTTLAKVLANELGVEYAEIFAPTMGDADTMIRVLSNIPENAVVFVDEIHRLSQSIQEKMYGALEDFEFVQYDKMEELEVRTKLPRFTMIGATTDAGKLLPPLLGRFKYEAHLLAYTQVELAELVIEASRIMYGFGIPMATASAIASVSQGTPRLARKFLDGLRELVNGLVKGVVTASDYTPEAFKTLLKFQRRDPYLGLDKSQRQYLVMLAREGKPVGAAALAQMTNEKLVTIEDKIEPYLMSDVSPEAGPLVRRSRQGRVATDSAREYLRTCRELQAEGWFAGESLTV